MSPSSARNRKPAPILGALFSLLVPFAALVSPACDNPESQVIARFPAEAGANAGIGAGADTGGSVETGGATGGGGATNAEAGAAGTPTDPFLIPAQRGRVKVVGGKLVTDIGTPLRGMLLPVDTTWDLADLNFLHELATTTGLNAVHVYLENSSVTVAGTNHLSTDALVPLAAREGLYVVIGYGTGMKVGAFDAAKLKAFWTYYAGRYAGYSNVVYEIQNDPEAKACKTPLLPATLAMEQQMYQLIRSKAPDTHILMFSTTTFVQPNVLTAAVQGVAPTVDWTNASFAIGGSTPCVGAPAFSTLTDAASAAGVSLFVSQLPPADDWEEFIPLLEQAGVGWLQYRWFGVQIETLATFNKAVTSHKLTWCPERGTFPVNFATCR